MQANNLCIDHHMLVPPLYRVMQVADWLLRISCIPILLLWAVPALANDNISFGDGRWIPSAVLAPITIAIAICRDHWKNKIESELAERIKTLVSQQARKAQRNGMHISHEIVADRNGDRLLIDSVAKQVRVYYLKTASRYSRYTVQELIFAFDEISKIRVSSKPRELEVRIDGSRAYTIGGALIGGLGGAITGALVDGLIEGIRGPKQFLLSIRFKLNNRKLVKFEPIRSAFGVTSDNLDEYRVFVRQIITEYERCLRIISRYFSDKL